MANLIETSAFEAGIYQLETSDPVLGGPGGISNLQPQQLANRTRFLKDQVDALQAAAGTYATLAQLVAELAKLDHKQSVRAATTANLASLSGLLTVDGVALQAGDRVLVKNQTAGAQNGIYVASASAWARATDADENAEVTGGMVMGVEEGALNGGTRWKLTTSGAITVGTTALVFTDILAGYAPLASPGLTGNPTAPTPAQFDNDQSLATTEFVQRALGNFATVTIEGANRVLTAADAGRYLYLNANNLNITLPDPAALPQGAVITVVQSGVNTGGQVLMPAGATWNGVMDGLSGSGPIALLNKAEYRFVRVSSTAYQVLVNGGNASLAAPGYQRLPSGLIVQWGTATASPAGTFNNFPIAFPTACRSVVLGQAGSSGVVYQSGGGPTPTGFTFFNASGTGSHFYMAIGH